MKLALGVLCAIVGPAGALLPILPGWPFLALGVLLLFPGTRFSRRLREQVERIPSAARLLSHFR